MHCNKIVIFIKMSKQFNEKRILFATNGTEIIEYSHAKKIHLDLCFILFIEIYFKWIIDLNLKAKIIKFSEENNYLEIICGNYLDWQELDNWYHSSHSVHAQIKIFKHIQRIFTEHLLYTWHYVENGDKMVTHKYVSCPHET